MPAVITLSSLSWSTPEGRTLFSHLDLTFAAERTGLVGRNGVGKSTLLQLISGQLRPQSGTITLNGTLGVLSQDVQVTPDQTVADLLGARKALALLRRAAAGEADADEVAAADWTLEARMESALERTGLRISPQTHLTDLSGGQRTRAALAAMLFTRPDFLLLDEPTNNLDREGREAVIALLGSWRGGAVVVSHDRELLEAMDAIVELSPLGAARYGGGRSSYCERKASDLAGLRRDLADAEKRVADAARKAQARVERQAHRDGAGRRQGAKGGIPRIALGGRKQSSEATSAGNALLAERRRAQALEEAAAARARIEVLQPLSVTLAPTGLAPGRDVLCLDGVTAGYRTGEAIVKGLSFAIEGPERVGLVGPNGSGKTTVLALIAGALKPWSGTVRVMVDSAMLDQRVSLLDPGSSIRDNFRRLNAGADENACRAALARFMFRADAALQIVGTLSGGQMLRAGLACVIGGAAPPPLLILDEPTNHLDLDAIAAVEDGLRAYDGALLVVSHDEAFIEAIGVTRRIDLTQG